MNKLLSLAVAAGALGGGMAQAQTPATNPMPDGSRDMYAGLGVQSAPRYEGTGSRKVSALPVLQVEWSNGAFISGMSAGVHLSASPTVEFGPLLAVQPGRDESGTGNSVGGTGSGIALAGVAAGQKAVQPSARLLGSASRSPLTERSTNLAVSTAIAYRF